MTTATTRPEIFTITRRSQNLGIGWSNTPVQERTASGGSRLRISDVTAPDVVGTLEDVAAEYDRARRINSGNDWRAVFFVGGVEVDREQLLYAMSVLRTRHTRERHEDRGRTRKWESDSETVYAVGSKALADLNRSVAAAIDAEYA